MKKILALLSLFFVFHSVYSQCSTNTSICNGSNAGPFTFVTPGPAVSTCLDFIGPGVGYIVLNISGSGNLNMLIDGNASSGFIDVAVFNIPQGVAPCTAIQNTSNQILCNYASSSSGCAQFGGQFGCPSNIGTVNVTAGQQLMIVAENWSGTSNDFTLQMSTAPGSATAGLPNATINPVGNLCVSSAAVQLTAVSMGGTWSGPGISPTGLFNPATAGVGAHTITYNVGIAPCNSTGQLVVNVTADPVVNLVSNSPVCIGESLTIAPDTTVNGIYTWTGPNGFTSSQSAILIPNVTAANAGTYTLGVDMWGCSASGTINVQINPNVTIVINSPVSMCLNDNATALTATVTTTGSTPPSAGVWSGVGITDSIAGTFNPTIAGVGTHTVTYTVSGACGNAATKDIIVKPHPALSLTSPVTAACVPMLTEATIGSDMTLDSLLIDFGNGTTQSAVGTYQVNYINPNCYDVHVWGIAQGCVTDSLFVDYFCSQPLPNAEPTVVKGTSTIYDPNFVFMNNSTGGTNWYWSFGDGKTSTEKNPTHKYSPVPGDYEVMLTVVSDFGCRDSAKIIIRIIEDVVFFAPNAFTPDGDQFNNIFKPVMVSGFRTDSYMLLIYNRWGELLFESHDPQYGWDGTYRGQVCQDGTYTWVITFKAKENSDSYRQLGTVTLIK